MALGGGDTSEGNTRIEEKRTVRNKAVESDMRTGGRMYVRANNTESNGQWRTTEITTLLEGGIVKW